MSSPVCRTLILCMLTCITACSTAPAAVPVNAPDFEQALKIHMGAVTSRDLATYESTLTHNDDLLLIFPNGKPIETTAGIVEFHRAWFEDKDWIFEPEVVKIIKGSDMATAVIKYNYRDNAQTEPRTSWLVMVFQLEDNEWRLAHDQNTRIE